MGINIQRTNNTWTLDTLGNWSQVTKPEVFGSILTNVDIKLNEIKKEISYWDIYNITDAITNSDEFDIKTANLSINSSVVINTDHFVHGFDGKEVDFYRGDIILKLKNGTYQHIKAANAGVYIPSFSTSLNQDSLDITYYYKPVVSDDEKEKSVSINFQGGTDSRIYGYSLPGNMYNSNENRFSFLILKDDNDNAITPVIKFFNDKNEEIYTDEYTCFIDPTDNKYFNFYLHEKATSIVKKVVIK